MDARYTIVLTRGSVCTNEDGRRALLSCLHSKVRSVTIRAIDPFGEDHRSVSIDLRELITILRHDSKANPAVLKALANDDVVVSISDYTARRGLSSAI
jgi:hypothetical protein